MSTTSTTTGDDAVTDLPPRGRGTTAVLMAAAVLLAGSGALILTDVGQLFGIGKSIVVGYFRIHLAVMAAAVICFVAAVWLNRRSRLLRTWMVIGLGVLVVVCLASTKFVVPYVLFRSQQHSAEYRTIAAADAEPYLDADDTVYVVDRGGVARAFPQQFIWQPHIFGGTFGDERVVLTYCVLTNLPVAYAETLDDTPMDLRVLAQTNNNLLLWDTASGEIIQQITSTGELSGRSLEPLPVLEMTWSTFRDLYPDGTVLYNRYDTPVERAMAFAMPLEDAHGGETWMFDTAATDDTRLPSKEQVIGVTDGEASTAWTREAVVREGVINTVVGDRALVIAHVPEHDLIVAFDRRLEDGVVEVTEIDAFGMTPEHGRLERAFIHQGPMWAVWAHYFPETTLVK